MEKKLNESDLQLQKLISQILNELVDTKECLEAPMLKTKLLAQRINHPQLLQWVNNELTGYTVDDVPDYRISQAQIRGSFINSNSHVQNVAIPTLGLSDRMADSLHEVKYDDGIAALESLIRNNTGRSYELQICLSAEVCAVLTENMQNMGKPISAGFKCPEDNCTNVSCANRIGNP